MLSLLHLPTSTLTFSPIPLPLLLTTLLLFPLTFHLLTTYLFPIYFAPHQTKRRAWILSSISSSLMTLGSLPFVWDFLRAGGDVGWMNGRRREGKGKRELLGEVVCTVFMGFLICDMVVGVRYYRQHINLLTGYIHHTIYIIVMLVALSTHQTYVFSLAAFLELPTFLLALSNLAPRWRNDYVFAVAFFLTRISFHSWICFAFLKEKFTKGGVGWEACFFLCLALPLHIHWFKNNLSGMIRRYNIQHSPSLKAQASPIHGPTTGILFDPSAPLAAIPSMLRL
ncbi:hypothetical protein BDY24DRAFT_419378 [Mrakia frigida]|uniref:uncharacterized protein n=1 Tax=Mrakia frigida TaxID=29902 RepID=UPI003FCBFBE2